MNETILVVLAALIVMGVGYPLVQVFSKWKKEMDERGEDNALE